MKGLDKNTRRLTETGDGEAAGRITEQLIIHCPLSIGISQKRFAKYPLRDRTVTLLVDFTVNPILRNLPSRISSSG